MKITIHVFAALKDYFDHEFSIETEKNTPVSFVLEKLTIINPAAKLVLSKSRIAINEKFVSSQHLIKNEERIFIIPPSSGG
jgi:molybdopterin synthase sulfur carrier subunit